MMTAFVNYLELIQIFLFDVIFVSYLQLSHLYTLIIRPDNTFEVFIDNKSVRSGKLDDEFDFLPAKEIKDPAQSKPKDWVDEKRIPDPDDVKPEGYDDIPAEIADPDATKPEDWDDEEDGEWEPPLIVSFLAQIIRALVHHNSSILFYL